MNTQHVPAFTATSLVPILDKIAEAERFFEPEALPTPQPVSRLAAVLDLTMVGVRSQLNGWSLKRPDSVGLASGVLGCVIQTPRGTTSPICGYDPASRRALTRTGSVYELAVPDPRFAASQRSLLVKMGF